MQTHMYPPSKETFTVAEGPAVYGPSDGFELTGRVLMSLLLVLLMMLLFFLLFHTLVRWFSRRHHQEMRRRRHLRRRQPNFVFSFPSHAGSDCRAGASSGLDPAYLRSLPCFVYSSSYPSAGAGEEGVVECSVCLCSMEEGEKGRRLAACGHSFHIDCIDLWLHAHATCPICRAEVKSEPSISSPPALEEEATRMPSSNETTLVIRVEQISDTLLTESLKAAPLPNRSPFADPGPNSPDLFWQEARGIGSMNHVECNSETSVVERQNEG